MLINFWFATNLGRSDLGPARQHRPNRAENDRLRCDLALRHGIREGRQSTPAAAILRMRTVGHESDREKLGAAATRPANLQQRRPSRTPVGTRHRSSCLLPSVRFACYRSASVFLCGTSLVAAYLPCRSRFARRKTANLRSGTASSNPSSSSAESANHRVTTALA